MLKDIRQKLLATFQIEHRDHVEQIRSLLALIEKTAGPPTGPALDEVFRRAHSLKGAARAVDLRPVEGLAHRLETLFSRVRQGVLLLDKNVTGTVQQVLDASEDCVTALGENRPSPDFKAALEAIERVLGIEPEAAAAEPESPESAPASQPQFQPLDTMRITAQQFRRTASFGRRTSDREPAPGPGHRATERDRPPAYRNGERSGIRSPVRRSVAAAARRGT